MSKEPELEPGDYHVAIRRREYTATPWRWEIWAAGRTGPVQQARHEYESMAEAAREGKAALKTLLRTKFPSAA